MVEIFVLYIWFQRGRLHVVIEDIFVELCYLYSNFSGVSKFCNMTLFPRMLKVHIY